METPDFFKQHCQGYNYNPTVLPKCHRIVALGDIHGDYDLCIEMLTLAKVIDNNLKWIGGSTIIVQVGDQIDRCRPLDTDCNNEKTTLDDENSDIRILELFTELDRQAQKSIPPGKVISLLGNHELMNVKGYMNYVSYKGLRDFKYNNLTGEEARKLAFTKGHKYAKFLGCTRLGAVIIGSNMFVHAGLIDKFLEELKINKSSDLDDINKKIQMWLLGLINDNQVSHIIDNNKYSMFWNRILGYLPENTTMTDPVCRDNLSKVLETFQIHNMIIAHTPQSFLFNKNINATCSDKIWRVDNGSSKAFHKFDSNYRNTGEVMESRKPQVLEIINDEIFNVIA